MKFIVFILAIFLSTPDSKPPVELKKITLSKSKKELTYHYSGRKTSASFKYVKNRSGVLLSMYQGKRLVLEAKKVKGKMAYRKPGTKIFGPVVREWIRDSMFYHIINVHVQDQQTFSGNSAFGGSGSGFNIGMPPMDNIGSDAGVYGASNCTTEHNCTCENGESVTINCNCFEVASCYVRTVNVCETDSAGNEVNCEEISGCVGRCSG